MDEPIDSLSPFPNVTALFDRANTASLFHLFNHLLEKVGAVIFVHIQNYWNPTCSYCLKVAVFLPLTRSVGFSSGLVGFVHNVSMCYKVKNKNTTKFKCDVRNVYRNV